MVSGANAAISRRLRRFPFSESRPRLVVAWVAAIVFAVHLLSMHSAHHGDSGHGVAESVSEATAASVADVVGGDHGPLQGDRGGAHTDDSGIAADGADVLTIGHPHGEVECGEVTQSRLGVAASALVPVLGCLWIVPRHAGLIPSQETADLRRWTPHLVRELGVQRV
jgi:hypothetical protein